ncbi:MAG: hypothetical protein NDJ89_04660 [Oligoflexia bacterium]|nr:hypothetical protein [Oligoflexia bacterium]
MKRSMILTLAVLLSSALAGVPAWAYGTGAAAPAAKASLYKGTVLETVSAARYTYIKVKTPQFTRWLATSEVKVNVGQQIEFTEGFLMKDFESKALKRKFPEVYFISGLGPQAPASVPAGGSGGSDPHAAQTAKKPAITVTPGSIEKAPGGYTVAEVLAKKTTLKDQKISVRGKVIKVNRNIMGRNWIHIEDGTAQGEIRELLLTSSEAANEGDVVLFTGKVGIDRDFGAGYKYAVLLEEAKIGRK